MWCKYNYLFINLINKYLKKEQIKVINDIISKYNYLLYIAIVKKIIMFMNKSGNGANLSNTVDVVANSIKLIRRINGIDVLLDNTDALEGHGSLGL